MVQISFGEVLEKTVIRDNLVTLQSSFHTMAFLSLLIKAHFTSKARIHHTQNKETKQRVRLRTMAWYWISHTLGMGSWPASAVVWLTFWHLFSPVQFNSRWYLGALKSPYALHPDSQKFPQCCLWNSSSVWVMMAFSCPFNEDHLALQNSFTFPPFQVLSMFIDSLGKWSVIVCAWCSSQQDAMSSAPEWKRWLQGESQVWQN